MRALRLTILTLSFFGLLHAEDAAKITELHNKVFRIQDGTKEKPAEQDEVLQRSDRVRTGARSRAQLTFPDKTITRVGSSTVFAFNQKDRAFDVQSGSVLFVFPKGEGGARITTAALTAGILGTTVFVEVSRSQIVYSCLEGKCRIGSHVIGPGQEIIVRNTSGAYNAPVRKFNIEKLTKSNELFTAFKAPLPSQALIDQEIKKQGN